LIVFSNLEEIIWVSSLTISLTSSSFKTLWLVNILSIATCLETLRTCHKTYNTKRTKKLIPRTKGIFVEFVGSIVVIRYKNKKDFYCKINASAKN